MYFYIGLLSGLSGYWKGISSFREESSISGFWINIWRSGIWKEIQFICQEPKHLKIWLKDTVAVSETHKVWLSLTYDSQGVMATHTKKSYLFKQNMRTFYVGVLSRTVRHQFELKQELLRSNAKILPWVSVEWKLIGINWLSLEMEC